MNTYRHVVLPNGTYVRWSRLGYWYICNRAGGLISRHDSREYAIRKARKMDREVPK